MWTRYDVVVDYSGELLRSFDSRADANKWLIDKYTKPGTRKTDSSICTLPYVVRIQKRTPLQWVLYDEYGNEKERGRREKIAERIGLEGADMEAVLMEKYLEIPGMKGWYVTLEGGF